MNEVRIIVRTQNDARAGFEAAERDAEAFGESTSESFRERFVDGLRRLAERAQGVLQEQGQAMGEQLGERTHTGFRQRFTDRIRNLGRDVDTSARRAGEDIGDRVGRAAGERIRREVDRSVRDGDRGRSGRDGENGAPSGGVDINRDGNFFTRLLRSAVGAGREAAGRFGSAFVGGLQSLSQTIVGQIMMILAVPIAAALSAPILAAVGSAITSGVLLALGGGVIAAGIASAFKDPRIQAAAGELKTRLGTMFEEFGKPFRGPLATFMEKFAGFLDSIAPDLKEISNVFAPVLDQLSTGVIAAMQNAWPGISEAIKASAPFVETLAKRMPEIGQAIGTFFRTIAGQGDDAQVFFNDLITVIIKIIGWTGRLIAAFTSWYANIRNIITGAKALFLAFLGYLIGIFGRILDAAATAFSWVPGLGAKLQGARAAFSRTREHINAELGKIRDKTVTIRMRTIGLAAANSAISVARTLSNMGYAHGGVRGAQDGATSSGLTWVGEAGPELVNLAPGSRVHTAGDSRRMSEGVGGGGELLVRLIADRTTERSLIDELLRALRLEIRNQGGNVQTVLGT